MIEITQNAVLFGADMGDYDMQQSMNELSALCEADGIKAVAEIVQKRDAPDVATFLGEGRIAEGKMYCHNLQADLAIFDTELSGSQIRNLESVLEVPVIDRTMLILDIFAKRANTNEGKLQTELASLKYRLPRLSGLGNSLSRQGGGGGGGGGARRGAGESKTEYDKRHIKHRIEVLSERLEEMKLRRAETRKSREKSGVPVLAFVGYTNVGKSSLLNKLCGADVLEADMLFATLDPTARKLTLPSGLATIAVDTVGFVSRLPHGLVEAFKSTLEEAAYADVIIKVCDMADPEAQNQLTVTNEVLQSLGCEDIPQITVYNKSDKTNGNSVLFMQDALSVSAKSGDGLAELLSAIDNALSDRVRRINVLLPYDKLSVAVAMRERGSVLVEEYKENGVYFEGIVKAMDLHHFTQYIVE